MDKETKKQHCYHYFKTLLDFIERVFDDYKVKDRDNHYLYKLIDNNHFNIYIKKYRISGIDTVEIYIYFNKYCIHKIVYNKTDFAYLIATNFSDYYKDTYLFQYVFDINLTKNDTVNMNKVKIAMDNIYSYLLNIKGIYKL